MIKIYQDDWNKIPTEVKQKCLGLTMRGDSGMLFNINRIVNFGAAHKIWYLMEDGDVVAWAQATMDYDEREYDIMLYVRRDRRCKGYGRQLFRRARSWVKRQGMPYFFFAAYENKSFFQKVAPEMF